MNDLIRRQDAIEAMAWAIWHYPNLSFLSNYGHVHELAEDALKRLPSTEPEIIRCKECVKIGFCGDETNLEIMGFNGFCSRAERRQDE